MGFGRGRDRRLRRDNIMVGSIATQRVLFDNEIVIMKSIVIKFRLEEE